jgi:hypothetical protein
MVARILIPALLLAGAAFGGSETPPEGPPWKRDILEAQEQALKEGKPVFFYFTKTY